MNYLLTLGLLLTGPLVQAQNRHTIFKDSAGAFTTYVDHHGATFESRYKSVYDKPTNTRLLVRRSPAEFAQEKAITEKRVTLTQKLGQPLPAFRAVDYHGRGFDSEQLKGRVLVLNFWFVGCGLCEMERASLNRLHAKYAHDSTVVFLSFVRSRREVVDKFLVDAPFAYPIATLDASLQAKFKPGGYPTNLVIDKRGRYAYEGLGAGVGSTTLLEAAIEQARRGNN
jgi:thiol-disulfide isomerase/thioredoxin